MHGVAQVWPRAVDCELFHPSRADPGMRRRLEGSHGAPPGGSGKGAPGSGPLLL